MTGAEYQKLLTYMHGKKPFFTEYLTRLVRIPSVRGTAEPRAPYGRMCAEVLHETESLYRENGFDAELNAEDGYLRVHWGEGSRSVGLFAHADVVPAGGDWTLAAPFSAEVRDGFMIGRGTGDNKAGIVISLAAAMAIRDLGIPFSSRLVLFTGSNEESGMGDLKRFLEKEGQPDYSLVPDAAFPVYRGERGLLHFWAVGRESFDTVEDFSGGEVFNIVLGDASVRLKNGVTMNSAAYQDFSAEDGFRIRLTGEPVISAHGIPKHAALPEGSRNAGFMLAEKLSGWSGISGHDRSLFASIASLYGDWGEGLGIKHMDPDFGRLTAANGIVRLEEGKPNISFDVTYGISIDKASMINTIQQRLDSLGFDFRPVKDSPGFIMGKDHPFLNDILSVYSACTGIQNPASYLNSGGTYARYLKNALSVGDTVWKDPPFPLTAGHGGCHQPDEFVSLDGVAEAAAILTAMVICADKTDRCDKSL